MKNANSIPSLLFKQQLKAYSIAAGSIVGLVAVSHATVRYTDIDPDKNISNHLDGYYLDLNNDGINDFFLIQINYTGISYYGSSYVNYAVGMFQLINNAVHGSMTSTSYGLPIPLNANDPIGNALSWQAGSYISFLANYNKSGTYTSSYGNWLGAKDKYLGLRLDVSGSTHYGWLRLDVNINGNGFSVKDYAYDDEPDKTIAAGDKGPFAGIDKESSIDPIFAYSFGKTIYVNDIAHLDHNADIRIYDMMGREVFHSPISGIAGKIDLPGAGSGNYIVKVETQKGIITRKIYLQ